MGNSRKRRQRMGYGLAFAVVLLIEILIALFVRDEVIRPYLGDVLVVAVLYFAVRTVLPDGCRLLPLYIFLFAAGMEGLQYFKLVSLLGLQNSRFFAALLGSVFDVKDILCYGAGCLLLGLYEWSGKGRRG